MAILPIQLARVSNLLRTSVSTNTISRTQKSLLEVQNELITGKRINVGSDDPGDAAVVQQLRKTLEQRAAYLNNVKQAGSHLGEVDSTLGDLTDLLQQAQDIASANVGSDVTADQRKSAASVVDNLYTQILSLANKQFEGMYLFAGDRLTDAPFVPENGGMKFVGSENVLSNTFDENSTRPFMVSGEEVFGALSTRVQGTADLTPSLTAATRSSCSSPTVIATWRGWPLRSTSSCTWLPGRVAPTMRGRSLEASTALLSNLTMMSLASTPALSAGLPFSTEFTSAPRARSRPNEVAMSRVTSWITTPMRPRDTRPLSRSCFCTSRATSIGIANERPMKPPVRL